MKVTSRLCNPTPIDVRWPYHAGIVINIPADSHVDLEYNQVNDFREGNPGYEAVKEPMDHLGIFLRDPDQTYESQALKAIRASERSKKDQLRSSIDTLRRNRVQSGVKDDPDAFDEVKRSLGMDVLESEIKKLEGRRKFLEKAERKVEAVEEKPDPKTTLIFVNPPRVFDSPVALQMFLQDEGKEAIKAKYEQWYEAETGEKVDW